MPNRRSFYDKLYEAILDAEKNKESFAILFLDLDGFKTINDTMGHAQGDETLKEGCSEINQCSSEKRRHFKSGRG